MTKSKLELTAEEILAAIAHEEFVLYYQPQFNLINSKLDALEALIRWQHPQWGLLQPGSFLPAVQELGLMAAIDGWVLHAACKQNRIWHDLGCTDLRIAVNVSPQLLLASDFIEQVEKALKIHQLKPEMLEIELTENILLHEDKNIAVVHQLKKLGVSIALDDFGTGYSSIAYLKKIQVDRIKIDKTFIDAIHHDQSDAIIVRAIIALAVGLNVQVLAEGVESLRQLQLLLDMECKEAQGFYFSEPLKQTEIEAVLIDYFEVNKPL